MFISLDESMTGRRGGREDESKERREEEERMVRIIEG